MFNFDSTFLIQAHRGYSGKYPENTLLAFEKAVSAESNIIEFDIHLSKDKELFVIHDERVDRTTDGEGDVYNMSSGQLRELDAGSWFDPAFAGEKIPTFLEVLNLIAQNEVIGNIEIKTEISGYKHWKETLHRAVEVIDVEKMWDQVIFTSFDLRAIREILQLRSQAYTALIDWRAKEAFSRQGFIREIGGRGWFGSSDILTEKLVNSAHEMNLKIISGGGKKINSILDDVKKLLRLGADGISTDYPKRALETVSKFG